MPFSPSPAIALLPVPAPHNMKTKPVFPLVSLFSVLVFAAAGCAREKNKAPETKPVTQSAPAPAESPSIIRNAQVAATTAAADAGNALAGSWDAIKDYTYEKRADFSAGVSRMAVSLDEQVRALKAKRATLSEASVKDWDFAMKELEDARSDLRSKMSELSKASSETWTQAKDRAAEAWKRAQDAAARVKASTTS